MLGNLIDKPSRFSTFISPIFMPILLKNKAGNKIFRRVCYFKVKILVEGWSNSRSSFLN